MRIFCVNRDVQDQKRYDTCRFGPISKAATSSWSSVPLGSIFRVYCYVGLPGDELTGPNGHNHYSDRCLRPWEETSAAILESGRYWEPPRDTFCSSLAQLGSARAFPSVAAVNGTCSGVLLWSRHGVV